jgi:hypothetical protein
MTGNKATGKREYPPASISTHLFARVRLNSSHTAQADHRTLEHSLRAVLYFLIQPEKANGPLACGNSLFDVLIYQASPAGITVQALPDAQRPRARSADDVARALFVQYFFVLTRGTYSISATNVVGSDMPNFLVGILGAGLTPLEYSEMLATFPILHLDARWVEHINFNAMDQAALSRFGLGVAGDRCFAPFKYLPRPPKATHGGQGSTPQLIAAYEVAMSFVNAAPNWDRHPTTRSPTILAQYGSLNNNATNLAIELWCNEDNTGPDPLLWQPLVNHKMIYAMPNSNVRHQEWKNWNVLYAPNAGRRIQFV